MKYGQIIKPEDVPRLVQCGEIRFGMVLEFSQSFGGPDGHFSQKFIGFNQERDHCFVAFGSPEPGLSKELLSFRQARFPLPALKDGDPVIVSISNLPAIFAGWLNNEIQIYACGTNKWTNSGRRLDSVGVWRLPTKKEIHEAGLDGWYDGRIELEEG